MTRNSRARRASYGRRQHVHHEHERRGGDPRAIPQHPKDCALPRDERHPIGSAGCVVVVAPETELERWAGDGNR